MGVTRDHRGASEQVGTGVRVSKTPLSSYPSSIHWVYSVVELFKRVMQMAPRQRRHKIYSEISYDPVLYTVAIYYSSYLLRIILYNIHAQGNILHLFFYQIYNIKNTLATTVKYIHYYLHFIMHRYYYYE